MRILLILALVGFAIYHGIKGWNNILKKPDDEPPAVFQDTSAVLPSAGIKEELRDASEQREAERLRLKLEAVEAQLVAVRDTKAEEAEAERRRLDAEQAAERKREEDRKKAERGFVAHVFKNRAVPSAEALGSVLPGEFVADLATNQIIAAVESADEAVDVSEVLKGLDLSPVRDLYRVEAIIVQASLGDAEEFSLEWLAKFDTREVPSRIRARASGASVALSSNWFDLALEKARDEGALKILSRPHLVLSPGESASVSSGREVPLPAVNVSDGNAQSSVEYRRVALETKATLEEVGDGRIALNVTQVNAQVGAFVRVGDSEVPEITSQEWGTKIVPEFAQWFAVGGVTLERKEDTTRRGLLTVLRKTRVSSRDEIGMFVRVVPATVEHDPAPVFATDRIPRAVPISPK